MKEYREFRVAVKSRLNEQWHFIWHEKSEDFDLDRYIRDSGSFYNFDPDDPTTNDVFEVFECSDSCYFGESIMHIHTDTANVWARWMESVKEVF